MTTTEGNILIAEFMKLSKQNQEWRNPKPTLVFMKDGYWMPVANLSYHQDWSWLMPVIEKMAQLKIKYRDSDEEFSPYPNTFGMVDNEGNYMVRVYCAPLFCATTLIEAAWLAVVDFLEWYSKEPAVQVSDTTNLNQGTER